MFGWLEKVFDKIKDLNMSVNDYQKETENQAIPSLAYVNRAKKLIEKLRYDEAKKVLKEALDITQKDALVYKYLGIAEEKLGNIDESIHAYKLSAKLNPHDKSIWHKLALAQMMTRNYDEALNSFVEADKVAPMNTDIHTGWGMVLLKQKKYEDAHEKFMKAVKLNRFNFAALLLAAIVEVRMGKYDDAENKLNFLINSNPNESSTYELANLYFLKGNYDGALKYAQQSIDFNKNMLPGYLLLGKIYSIKFDYENSMKYFEQAKNNELESALLYVEWGNALVRLYRFAEAKEKYQKALYEDINLSEAQSGMALCCAETKDFEKAFEFMSILKEKNEDNIFITETGGIQYYADKNYSEAIKCFKKSLENSPDSIYNYYRLAKCYEQLENSEMVKDSYEKFLKYNPGYVPVYMDYARYLISLNDYPNAQRKLRKALRLEEENEEILNLLFYISYILVKENICEYNVKEAIAIADKIKNFDYPELKADLEEILKEK